MENLLKVSLIISILGIFFLLFLTNFLAYKEITSLSNLTLNEKARIEGKIIEEKTYGE